MNAKPFLDTNILIYAFVSNDPRGPKGEGLVEAGGIISVQVLNEFVNVCLTKIVVQWPKIEAALETVRTLLDPPVPITRELHEHALVLARTHRLGFYDSLIVAAAISANCETLFSEDMQHGRKIGTITIRNPFA